MPVSTILAALLVAATPAAADPETIARSGKWRVDYDQDACHLDAVFGAGKDQVILRFTRYSPTSLFDIMLVGPRLTASGARVDLRLDFGLGEEIRTDAAIGTTGKNRALIVKSMRIDGGQYPQNAQEDGAPPVTPQQEASVQSLTIKMPARRPFRLATGPLDKPMAALRGCTADLIRFWGYDLAIHSQLRSHARPLGQASSWLRSQDFPQKALNNFANGMVQFRMDIDTAGRPTACRVLFRTNPDLFADATCNALMKRANFTPAIDATGAPTRSYYVGKVDWRFP